MPTRYLKPGICDSDRIDLCRPEAEILWYRLLVNVDDFGRLDARPSLVRSKCFPIKESMNSEMVSGYLQELSAAGLLVLYEHEGRPYLQLSKWENKARSQVSKCPAFEQGCIQLHTSVSVPPTSLPGTGTGTGTGTVNREPEHITETVNPAPKKPARFDPLSIELPECLNSEAWHEWIAYRRERKLTTCKTTITSQVAELVAWAKLGHDPTGIIKTSIAKGWQGLFEPKQGNQNGNYSDFVAELTGRNRRENAPAIDGQAERVD